MKRDEMKQTVWGLVVGFALTACVAAKIQYTYYNLDIPDGCYQQGKLLGDTVANDIPLTNCQPDPTNKFKCAHLLMAEWQRINTDLEKCQTDLTACQQSIPTGARP